MTQDHEYLKRRRERLKCGRTLICAAVWLFFTTSALSLAPGWQREILALASVFAAGFMIRETMTK